VFGLLSTAVTWTYLPPIWLMTLAYWFSAPTATTTPLVLLAVEDAELVEQAAASSTTAGSTMAAVVWRTFT